MANKTYSALKLSLANIYSPPSEKNHEWVHSSLANRTPAGFTVNSPRRQHGECYLNLINHGVVEHHPIYSM